MASNGAVEAEAQPHWPPIGIMVLRRRECEDAEPLHSEKQLLAKIRARYEEDILVCVVMTWQVDARGQARAFKYDADANSCCEVSMPVVKVKGGNHRLVDFRHEDGTVELAEMFENIELRASPLRPVSHSMPSKRPRPKLQCHSVSLPSMVMYAIQKH